MARKREHIEAESGDIVGIPQTDGRFRLAQVVRRWRSGAVLALMFEQTVAKESPDSGLHLTPTLTPLVCVPLIDGGIATGVWPILDRRSIVWPEAVRHAESMDRARLVGVKVINSLIAEDFADALAGLKPWDMYLDPNYFDRWLIPGVKRPSAAFTTKS